MRFLAWLFNFALFVVALGFALSNTDSVELHFLVGKLSWHAPLVVFLLIFLIAGVVLGLLAATPSLFRQRREISRLRKAMRLGARAGAAPSPVPESAVDPTGGVGL